MKRFFWTTLIVVVLWNHSMTQAGVVQCEILQYRASRLYFPLGEEDYVVANCGFAVLNGEDTLYSGKIEEAHPGVCYSFPDGESFDTLDIDSCYALVETYDVDCSIPIRLGTIGFDVLVDSVGNIIDSSRLLPAPVEESNIPFSSAQIQLTRYENGWSMVSAFDAGLLDGYFANQSHWESDPDCETISSPAPYYAALLPSVRDHFQDNSLLTTSLYYRFDDNRHAMVFEGDRVQSVDCLNCSYSDCPRSIWFNPVNGKELIRHIRSRGKKFVVVAEDISLENTAMFFTDILSRDRLRTKLRVGSEDGNCYVTFVPIREDSLAPCLRYIHDRLATDTMPDKQANEAIAMVGSYLDLGDGARDLETRKRFYRQAEVALQEIGVFPLFRPTVFFTSHKHLRGASFNPVGQFEISHLVRLIPPKRSPGVTP